MLLNGKRVDLGQLAAELTAAGVAHRGLGQAGDDLHTYTAVGAVTDLPAQAATVVSNHTPPALPVAPDYGNDLQTSQEYAGQAASAVSNLRSYIGLSSPTQAQTVAVVKLLCRGMIFCIKRQAGL